MLVNKDIIIRVGLGLIVLIMFIRIVVPVIFETLKRKIPGSYVPENDLDNMIRRQKERLRAEYGLASNTDSQPQVQNSSVEAIYKESRWGGGNFAKKMQDEITKNYAYTLAESKVNAFILLSEKRNYLRFLNADNQKSEEAIKNYLSMLMLFFILIEEIKNKELQLIEKVAKKCRVSPTELLIALQIKLLSTVKNEKGLKDDKILVSTPTLHQYSEETIKEAMEMIAQTEANLWARGHSLFFEELSLYLTYADILAPLPKLKDKKDLATAYHMLGVTPETDTDEIKKIYKKMAMTRHPDKIGQMKLSKFLEGKAISKFSHLQEAYEIIMNHRKK